MAREPEEEETVRTAALVRRCPRCPGWPGAPRPPFWLLCLVACWILGAVADADFSILDEAQVLASQMRRLAAEELGVVTMQVSDPLRAASLAALSGCAEPRGATPSAPAGCGTSGLLQTFPNPVLSVPSTPLPLPSSAMPLPRTHFPPLLGRGFFLVGWEFSHYPRLLPQFALSSFADWFSLVSPANSLFLFVSPSLGTGSRRARGVLPGFPTPPS